MAVNLNVDESATSLIAPSKFGSMNSPQKRPIIIIICLGLISLIIILSILFSPTFLLRGSPKQLNSPTDSPPNIVFIMADDLGWANVGFHNAENAQIATPRIDWLARDGLELNRMYVYRGCAPTRSSFQSGRLPIHVTTDNDDGIVNPFHGMPADMTSFADKLKEADYATYLLGKWDVGFASWAQMPSSRGWDYFYGYLGKTIDYFHKWSINDCANLGDLDLWENGAPAFESEEATDNEYVEFGFRDRALDILDHHRDGEGPPFVLLYSSHLPHYPTHVPEQYIIDDPYHNDNAQCSVGTPFPFPEFNGTLQCRTLLQSQVNLLDEIVGQIHDRLIENNLWDNTLFIFQSDNGGHIELSHGSGNNYPLRGGKMTDFEGGVRAVTFVNGGWLPDSRRGQVESGLMHIADWYATFCALANVDPTDTVATNAGLPGIDSVNLVPLLLGDVTDSPRSELLISVSTMISGEFKIMTGGYNYAIWQAPVWPDGDTPSDAELQATNLDCTQTPCLFNIFDDESERYDLAGDDEYAEIYEEMFRAHNLALESVYQANFLKSVYETNGRGSHEDSCPDEAKLVTNVGIGLSSHVELGCGCWMAQHNYNNFDGPYTNLIEEEIHFDDDVHTRGGGVGGDDRGNGMRSSTAAPQHEHDKVDYSKGRSSNNSDSAEVEHDFEHEFEHEVEHEFEHDFEYRSISDQRTDSETETDTDAETESDIDIAELVEDEFAGQEREREVEEVVEEERVFADILVLHDDNTYDVYKKREEMMLNGGRASGVEPRTDGAGYVDLVYLAIGVATVMCLVYVAKYISRRGRRKGDLLQDSARQMSYGSHLGL